MVEMYNNRSNTTFGAPKTVRYSNHQSEMRRSNAEYRARARARKSRAQARHEEEKRRMLQRRFIAAFIFVTILCVCIMFYFQDQAWKNHMQQSDTELTYVQLEDGSLVTKGGYETIQAYERWMENHPDAYAG